MLDGVEVGGVGGQEHQPAPGRLHERPRGRRAVEAGVVQHDHAPPRDRRQEHLREIRVHHGAVAIALEHHRAHEAAAAGRGDDARAPAPRPADLRVDPLPPGRARVRPVQAVVDAALVKEIHVGVPGQGAELPAEEPPPRLVPLAVPHEFFLT